MSVALFLHDILVVLEGQFHGTQIWMQGGLTSAQALSRAAVCLVVIVKPFIIKASIPSGTTRA